MAAGAAPLERCGERIARLVSMVTSGHSGSSDPAEGERPKKRQVHEPGRELAKRLERYRPGLVPFMLDGLAGDLRPPGLGAPPRPDERADPDDPDPEQRRHQRRGGVRGAPPATRRGCRWSSTTRAPAGAGSGCPRGRARLGGVEFAPIPELIDVIRPGGLANQKAPRIQATLRKIREERGDYSLEFLGEMSALEARDWLTRIDGIGKKTASVLLLFCFGSPLLPIDRHVERVMRRVGMLPRTTCPSRTPTTSSSGCSRRTRCTRRTST